MGDALKTAGHILNHVPSTAVDKTPFDIGIMDGSKASSWVDACLGLSSGSKGGQSSCKET